MIAHVALRLGRRAAQNLLRAPLPSGLSVLTIALALFLGAAFVQGLRAAEAVLRGWGAQAAVTVYLERSASDADAEALAQTLRAANAQVDAIAVDRARALARLKTDLGDLAVALDGLPRNPLPPSVEIEPRARLAPAELRALAASTRRLPRVAEVDDGREWLDRLEALGRSLRAFGAGALLLVLGAALLVVANTIRLAVYARRDEIEIMKLVGATNAYARAPFLVEGALQGFAGGLLSLGALAWVHAVLLPRAAASFSFAAGADLPRLGAPQALAIVAAGFGMGLVGSWLAVSRFLRA